MFAETALPARTSSRAFRNIRSVSVSYFGAFSGRNGGGGRAGRRAARARLRLHAAASPASVGDGASASLGVSWPTSSCPSPVRPAARGPSRAASAFERSSSFGSASTDGLRDRRLEVGLHSTRSSRRSGGCGSCSIHVGIALEAAVAVDFDSRSARRRSSNDDRRLHAQASSGKALDRRCEFPASRTFPRTFQPPECGRWSISLINPALLGNDARSRYPRPSDAGYGRDRASVWPKR